jgi:glutamate dehydrogenase (NAD(P)+)
LEIVNGKLHEIMTRAFAETLGMSQREGVHMRLAAYLLAVQRVADATSIRGLYP